MLLMNDWVGKFGGGVGDCLFWLSEETMLLSRMLYGL